jgi:hypothetical protein
MGVLRRYCPFTACVPLCSKAPTGRDNIAQGAALGKAAQGDGSPVRAKCCHANAARPVLSPLLTNSLRGCIILSKSRKRSSESLVRNKMPPLNTFHSPFLPFSTPKSLLLSPQNHERPGSNTPSRAFLKTDSLSLSPSLTVPYPPHLQAQKARKGPVFRPPAIFLQAPLLQVTLRPMPLQGQRKDSPPKTAIVQTPRTRPGLVSGSPALYYARATWRPRNDNWAHLHAFARILADGEPSATIVDREQPAKETEPDGGTPVQSRRIASRWQIPSTVALVLPAADVSIELIGDLIDQEFAR